MLLLVPAGTLMLLADPSLHLNPQLFVEACQECIRTITARIKAGEDSSLCLEAIWTLLQQQQPPRLPQPDLSMFVLAAEAVVAASQQDIPALQAVVLLQQHVWGPIKDDPSAISAYLPALNAWDQGAAVQTVLLMAQNGLASLDYESCLFVCCNIEELQLEWIREKFGTSFVEQLEAVAESDPESSCQAVVFFPDLPLPKLTIVQLSRGAECLVLQGQDTPWWMLIGGVQHELWHAAASDKIAVDVASTDEPAAAKPSLGPAEELLAEYGQDRKKSRRKDRRS